MDIFASDSEGLLYGLLSFAQIIQLHSEIVGAASRPSLAISNVGAHALDNVKAEPSAYLSLPSVHIEDWPTIANRGVLCAYRNSGALMHSGALHELVKLLSTARANQLFLVIDTVDDPCRLDQSDDRHTHVAHVAAATKLYALDEICKRHFLELIPTIVLTDPRQRRVCIFCQLVCRDSN